MVSGHTAWVSCPPAPGEAGSAIMEDNERIAYVHSGQDTATRIVQCVNALAGIPDPEAWVREAREALEQSARTMVEWYVQDQADVIGSAAAEAAAEREVGAIQSIRAVLKAAGHG